MKVPTPEAGDLRAARGAVLEWYAREGRALPIRGTRDPWAILVAEVMAQQTQISRVGPAWQAFLEAYPRPLDLAAAPTAEVLRAWSGLGYNRRAVSLQRAAQLIVERHAGVVPPGIAELEALPGVGPYTARAVAATAFGQPVAAVDTNVRRVVTRLAGDGQPTAKQVQAAADRLLGDTDPATWTHALIDLGATICRPTRPDCGACPLARWCESAGRAGAARVRTARVRRSATVPFEATTRWLRGRIVERLRDADGDAWVMMADPIGAHDRDAVAAAMAGLERDGLLERRHDGQVRLPSGGDERPMNQR